MNSIRRIATVTACTAVVFLIVAGAASPARAGSASAGSLVVLADFVVGAPTPGPNVPSCVQLSQFPQGSKVVIRTRVIDGSTGEELSDSDLSSVQVTLDGGIVLNETYGGHPGGGATPTDHFWSAAWTIPADYPTGTVDVAITATAFDGRTATWVPFNVAASSLTVVPAASSGP
jgi:hypothetical protein